MTFEAITDDVRSDPDAMRAWAQSQSVADLVAMAEAGYLNTDTLRGMTGPVDPTTGRPTKVEINSALAEQVDAMLKMRHDHATLVAGLATLDEKNVGVAMVLPGIDDVEAAIVALPQETRTVEVAILDDDGTTTGSEKATEEGPPAWHLAGDVLYVDGVSSEQVAEALRTTRP